MGKENMKHPGIKLHKKQFQFLVMAHHPANHTAGKRTKYFSLKETRSKASTSLKSTCKAGHRQLHCIGVQLITEVGRLQLDQKWGWTSSSDIQKIWPSFGSLLYTFMFLILQSYMLLRQHPKYTFLLYYLPHLWTKCWVDKIQCLQVPLVPGSEKKKFFKSDF